MAHIYSLYIYLYLTHEAWVTFLSHSIRCSFCFCLIIMAVFLVCMFLVSEGTYWVINNLSPHMFWTDLICFPYADAVWASKTRNAKEDMLKKLFLQSCRIPNLTGKDCGLINSYVCGFTKKKTYYFFINAILHPAKGNTWEQRCLLLFLPYASNTSCCSWSWIPSVVEVESCCFGVYLFKSLLEVLIISSRFSLSLCLPFFWSCG